MNVAEQARRTYGQASAIARSPRSVEYAAIGRITHELRNSAIHRESNFPAFAAALHKNNALWSALAVDISLPENALPDDLKARLFWIAEFTQVETRKILRGTGEISALIDINAAVMHGLSDGEIEE